MRAAKRLLFLCVFASFFHGFLLESVTLKVFDLNVWGLKVTGKAKAIRFRSIKNTLKAFDVVLLQEVWFRKYHRYFEDALPHSTSFDAFNPKKCGEGFLHMIPVQCSGLQILSRFPFEKVDFHRFKAQHVYSFFVFKVKTQKGLADVRVRLGDKITADVFDIHTASFSESKRASQCREAAQRVSQSDATFIIFSGDINDTPDGECYKMLTDILTDTLTRVHPDDSFNGDFGTFANKRNSFSGRSKGAPKRIDFIMYRRNYDGVAVNNVHFEMPDFRAQGRSYSDHEVLTASFNITLSEIGNKIPVPEINATLPLTSSGAQTYPINRYLAVITLIVITRFHCIRVNS